MESHLTPAWEIDLPHVTSQRRRYAACRETCRRRASCDVIFLRPKPVTTSAAVAFAIRHHFGRKRRFYAPDSYVENSHLGCIPQ